MRASKQIFLLVVTTWPVASGFSQSAISARAAEANSREETMTVGRQANARHNLLLAFQAPAPGAGDGSAAQVPGKAGSLRADEPLSLEATDLDLEAQPSANPGLALILDERAFARFYSLDLNADGALTLDEWQHFDATASAKEHFRALDENGDGQLNAAEFLRQVPKHPALYEFLVNAEPSKAGYISWKDQALEPGGLRLFSINF